MKRVFLYISEVAACAALGCLLLFLVSLIPESAVREQSVLSAQQLNTVGRTLSIIGDDDDPRYCMDNYTDMLIMMEAYTLTSDTPLSFLTNPYYVDTDSYDQSAFEALISGRAEADIMYVRYWQGFRVFIRPLMMLWAWLDIKKFFGGLFYVAFAVMTAVVSAKRGLRYGLSVGVSTALFEPMVIASSLQYIFCFLLMFCFVIFVAVKDIREEYEGPLFAFFGIAVQFFDFYTVPLITLAMPLLMLMSKSESGRWKRFFRCVLAWLYGYAAMWLLKLALTTAFTGINGFSNGLGAFVYRVSVDAGDKLSSFITALSYAWYLSSPCLFSKTAFVLMGGAVIVSAYLIRKSSGFKGLFERSALLAVGALPIIWTAAASQPMNVHAWFQYRIMLALYAAVFFFAAQCIKDKEVVA